MGHRTALYDAHLAAGGKMVDFGGWDMPINYGSQIEEHHAVRQHAGVFALERVVGIGLGRIGRGFILGCGNGNQPGQQDTGGQAQRESCIF